MGDWRGWGATVLLPFSKQGTEMSNERTLLVVEDNEVAREGLAAILRRAGYEVALATNGQEALNYLDGHPPPALILLDMLMPVLDGWHFLEQLQGDIPEPTVEYRNEHVQQDQRGRR